MTVFILFGIGFGFLVQVFRLNYPLIDVGVLTILNQITLIFLHNVQLGRITKLISSFQVMLRVFSVGTDSKVNGLGGCRQAISTR